MLRIAVLLIACFGLAGCANSPTCYRITSADTWVSGGPGGYGSNSKSHDYYGDLTDRTRTDGDAWSIEGGVNFHWDSTCEYEYYEEEEETPVTEVPPVTPVPGGAGGPR